MLDQAIRTKPLLRPAKAGFVFYFIRLPYSAYLQKRLDFITRTLTGLPYFCSEGRSTTAQSPY